MIRGFVFGLVISGVAYAAPFSVSGLANIYAAGRAAVVAPGGGGGGVLPFLLNIPIGATSFQVSNVTGLVDCVVRPASIPADGDFCVSPSTFIQGYEGISGIVANSGFGRQMFLVGVAIGPTEPSGAPPARLEYGPSPLDYSQSSYSPLLGQVFFIGDGLTGTGSGSQQTFVLPTGATRLYLGFADAFDFGDSAAPLGNLPGYYNDNVGRLLGDVTFNSTVVIPEPSTAACAAAAGMLLVVFRRRANSRN